MAKVNCTSTRPLLLARCRRLGAGSVIRLMIAGRDDAVDIISRRIGYRVINHMLVVSSVANCSKSASTDASTAQSPCDHARLARQ